MMMAPEGLTSSRLPEDTVSKSFKKCPIYQHVLQTAVCRGMLQEVKVFHPDILARGGTSRVLGM